MKLKNKKTGEVVECVVIPIIDGYVNEYETFEKGESLAELNEEWEDAPEEPKAGYIIDPTDEDCVWPDDSGYEEPDIERAKELGIWFQTEKEAELAVRKLKAWKRLKDKGFRFDGYDVAHNSNGDLCGQLFYNAGDYCIEDVEKDLDLLFEGEEWK